MLAIEKCDIIKYLLEIVYCRRARKSQILSIPVQLSTYTSAVMLGPAVKNALVSWAISE